MATKSNTATQTRQNWPEGQIVHTEFITPDPKSLTTFLAKTFDWKIDTQKMPDGTDYHLFTTPGGVVGGITAPPFPNAPTGTTCYINVDDIKAAQKKCEKAGAKILMPATEIPKMGWFFQFQVKNGPILACFQGPN